MSCNILQLTTEVLQLVEYLGNISPCWWKGNRYISETYQEFMRSTALRCFSCFSQTGRLSVLGGAARQGVSACWLTVYYWQIPKVVSPKRKNEFGNRRVCPFGGFNTDDNQSSVTFFGGAQSCGPGRQKQKNKKFLKNMANVFILNLCLVLVSFLFLIYFHILSLSVDTRH